MGPLEDQIKRINIDDFIEKKLMEVNSIAKYGRLLNKYGTTDDVLKFTEHLPVITTLAYEQTLQEYELDDAFVGEIGVYDPLHWKSLALFSELLAANHINNPGLWLYIQEAIQRKSECQIVDFHNGWRLVKNNQEYLDKEFRLRVYQMMNEYINKERQIVACQMQGEDLLGLVANLEVELIRGELTTKDLLSLLLSLLKLVQEEEFDGHLEDAEWKQLADSVATVAKKHPGAFPAEALSALELHIQ